MVEFSDHFDTSEVSSAGAKKNFPRQVINPEDWGVMWNIDQDRLDLSPEFAERIYNDIKAHLNNPKFDLDEQRIIIINHEWGDTFRFFISIPHKSRPTKIIGTITYSTQDGKLEKVGKIQKSKIIHDEDIIANMRTGEIDKKEDTRRRNADALYFLNRHGLANGETGTLVKLGEEFPDSRKAPEWKLRELKERLLKKYAEVLLQKKTK